MAIKWEGGMQVVGDRVELVCPTEPIPGEAEAVAGDCCASTGLFENVLYTATARSRILLL